MRRVTDLRRPPLVGRYYLVPCVRVPKDQNIPPGWRPVLGPRHEDRAVIGFPFEHWHYDHRFTPPWLYRLHTRDSRDVVGAAGIFDAVLADVDQELGPPVLRPRKCWRRLPVPPCPPVWLADMERACAHLKLPGCRVCPHRGLPLASLPVGADGTVTCPGHGLSWNVRTGDLVRRAGR